MMVGDTGIEPVTSTVSRCRAVDNNDESCYPNCTFMCGFAPTFPLLTYISPQSVGPAWGGPVGPSRRACHPQDVHVSPALVMLTPPSLPRRFRQNSADLG